MTDLAVLLPLLAAFVVGAVPRSEPGLARTVAVLAAVAELAVLLALVWSFDVAGPTVQLTSTHAWLPAHGINWSLGVDGSALPLLILLGVAMPLALAIGDRSADARLLVGLLVLQSAWVTLALARDLVLLAAAWELSCVVTVMLLAAGHAAAALRYAACVLPGAAALAAVVVLLGVAHAHASGGMWRWDLDSLALVSLPPSLQNLGFVLGLVAVATALPLLPLQAPLVAIAAGGPTPVVAAVLGMGMPVGLWLLQRVLLPMFPLTAGEWADPLAAVATVGAIYAALVCWAERDPGRLLGHVALLHLSLAIVAVLSASPAARIGLGPYLLAHGLGLVLLTGVLHGLRRHGIDDLGELAGWGRSSPRALVFSMLAVVLLLGVPGTAGFVGGLGIVAGVVAEGEPGLLRPTTWSLLACASVGLGSLGLLRRLWLAGRGSPRVTEQLGRLDDLDLRETVVGIISVAIVLGVGLMPNALLTRTEPSVRDSVDALQHARCLAIEGRGQTRPRMREEFGAVCLDPVARIRGYYGLDPADHSHPVEPAEPVEPEASP
jgi:NADH-quinone oxidoreductase subunit M